MKKFIWHIRYKAPFSIKARVIILSVLFSLITIGSAATRFTNNPWYVAVASLLFIPTATYIAIREERSFRSYIDDDSVYQGPKVWYALGKNDPFSCDADDFSTLASINSTGTLEVFHGSLAVGLLSGTRAPKHNIKMPNLRVVDGFLRLGVCHLVEAPKLERVGNGKSTYIKEVILQTGKDWYQVSHFPSLDQSTIYAMIGNLEEACFFRAPYGVILDELNDVTNLIPLRAAKPYLATLIDLKLKGIIK